MTANLQTGMTVKQAAKALNVSERGIYDAKRLIRTGRTDLVAAVERGDMSLNKALLITKEKKQPASAYQRLILAWNACSEDEQGRFLVHTGSITK